MMILAISSNKNYKNENFKYYKRSKNIKMAIIITFGLNICTYKNCFFKLCVCFFERMFSTLIAVYKPL